MLSNNYAWYMEDGELAIIDDSSGSWDSVTSAVTVDVDYYKYATDLDMDAIATESQIPEDFVYAVIYKSISELYLDPRNFNEKMAAIFRNKYLEKTRCIRKDKNENKTDGNFVIPRYF